MSTINYFPPIEPYDSGTLPTPDGHHLYWESSGNPQGIPALLLHGGPGGGASPGQRRLFNPELYRIIIFDQRGCGRSRPLASAPDADLSTNTTPHLIADIELLRRFLDVQRWTILGLSWGTTLALAYAQKYPQHVHALLLAFVSTCSKREVDWITRGVGSLFPEQWHRFSTYVPESLHHLPLVDAYAALLFDPDPAVRERAALEWCIWEDAHISLSPDHRPTLQESAPEFRLGFARLVTHYWRHAAFLEDEQLIRDASKLNGIPGVLIHGRYDVSSPLETPWRLSRNWTTSHLHILPDAGHGGGDSFYPTIQSALQSFPPL